MTESEENMDEDSGLWWQQGGQERVAGAAGSLRAGFWNKGIRLRAKPVWGYGLYTGVRYRFPRYQHGRHGRAGSGGEDKGGMPEGTYRAGHCLCELCAGRVQGKGEPFPLERWPGAGVHGWYIAGNPIGGAGCGVRIRGGERAA